MSGVTARFAEPVKPLLCAMMVVDPTCTAVASPPLVTLAISVRAELQVMAEVMFWVVPSLMVAIAWSWRLLSKTIDIVDGTIFKAIIAAGVTVRFADPVTDPALALIVAVPMALARTVPAALTLAIGADDEFHVAD
jgi:hypothetical protein